MKTRPTLLISLFAVAAVLGGCDCRGKGIGSNLADLGVVWRDTDGSERVDRDALYDFGTAFVGDNIPKKMIIRNTGVGELKLVTLQRVDGAVVSIGDEKPADAAFDVRFVPGATVASTAAGTVTIVAV